jgi:hypothetical protein
MNMMEEKEIFFHTKNITFQFDSYPSGVLLLAMVE